MERATLAGERLADRSVASIGEGRHVARSEHSVGAQLMGHRRHDLLWSPGAHQQPTPAGTQRLVQFDQAADQERAAHRAVAGPGPTQQPIIHDEKRYHVLRGVDGIAERGIVGETKVTTEPHDGRVPTMASRLSHVRASFRCQWMIANLIQILDSRPPCAYHHGYTNLTQPRTSSRESPEMTKHTLRSSQLVPADLEQVWSFFSSAANLGRITPRSMSFEIHTPDPSTHEGATIDYTVRPLFGIPTQWQTRIDSVEAPVRFRDTQVKGPYKSWVHEHRFTEVAGGVRMEDRVDYEMPFGPLGSLGHRMAVRNELEHVFNYRTTAINNIFEPAGDTTGAAPGTIAVAGGTGFVGGEIARELRRRGRHVVVLSSRGEHARGQLPDDIEIRQVDVRDPAALDTALRGVDELVISLAFPGLPVEQPSKGYTFMEVDAGGTEQLIEAGKRAGVGRVVYISGAGAGHEAKRHWFRAKAVAEDAVRGSGMAWTILRPTWVFGPGDVSLNRFLGFARVLPFVPMTNFGNQRLAPVYVGDVAKLAADSLTEDAALEQVFEVGGPETLNMREILHRAMAITGVKKVLLPAPAAMVKVAAWPMRFLPNPPLSPDAVDFVNQPATVDIEPLLRAMPRTMTRLETGLASYMGPQRSNVSISDGREESLQPVV